MPSDSQRRVVVTGKQIFIPYLLNGMNILLAIRDNCLENM
jgi:hypothetical protein